MRLATVLIMTSIGLALLGRAGNANAGFENGIDDGYAGNFDYANSRSAGDAVAQARLELVRKQQAFSKIGFLLEHEMKDSGDWQVACAELMAKRRRVEAIRQPLVHHLRESHAWRSTQVEIEQAEMELEQVRQNDTSSHRLTEIATRLLNLRRANSARETALTRENPELQDALVDLSAAADTLGDIRYQQLGNLANRADWRAAKVAMTSARDQLVVAQAAHNRERRSQAQNERERIVQMRAFNRENHSGNFAPGRGVR